MSRAYEEAEEYEANRLSRIEAKINNIEKQIKIIKQMIEEMIKE